MLFIDSWGTIVALLFHFGIGGFAEFAKSVLDKIRASRKEQINRRYPYWEVLTD